MCVGENDGNWWWIHVQTLTRFVVIVIWARLLRDVGESNHHYTTSVEYVPQEKVPTSCCIKTATIQRKDGESL